MFAYGDDLGRVEQTIFDPEGDPEWLLIGQIDASASRESGRAVVTLPAIDRLG